MPRYDFQCRQCSYTFESELPFGSDEEPSCPECGKDTNRLISPPAIHFKGAGFYNSDNRKPAPKPKESDVGAQRTVPEEAKSDEGTNKDAKKKEKKSKKDDCSA
ncbi:MAG: zinc ribbon domain-containing protein [Candidatus Peribacteraceae bacterium]|jgi:putative FmdB family regulatory protein|nr:zinc ribbon domain-containing protein [Candidatus Peribacteraceae bacterium]MDP7454213.1 zinc ribbon domain-containing protein [Candidatus Peribacteraceae bacterium]MDP7646140.1 zinc ribbon domain-containing protein [Candidatus Peribacteraceae bacterium]HJO61471.1 zinc ribbon domain-containing protein [Desulfobacterales bacterium]